MILPARSIFVATGARPNIAYEFEHRGTFQREVWNIARYADVDGDINLYSSRWSL